MSTGGCVFGALTMAVLIVSCLSRETSDCYALEKNPYLMFGTKTAYHYVYGRYNRQHDHNYFTEECEPVQIWLMVRHGTRYPGKQTIRAMQQLEKLAASIVQNHEDRKSGRLCYADLDHLKEWSLNVSLTDAKLLTTQGRTDVYELAKRLRTRFPKLLGDKIYAQNLFEVGLPYDLKLYWQQYPWTLGVGLCKLRAFISEMGSYTSVLTIVAFSMERYLAICHPLHHYTMSGLKRAIRIIAVLWVVSFAGAAPFAVFTKVNYQEYPPDSGNNVADSAICALLDQNLPPNWPLYEISMAVFFLVPMMVILILYLRMGLQIRQRVNRRSLSRNMEGSVHETSSRKAVIRMLAAVVVAFFLCWAPFHAQRLIYIYARDSPHYNVINEWMYHIAGCFYYFSSTVNPILYNVMSAKYRAAFRETLFGLTPQTNSDSYFTKSRMSIRQSNLATNAGEVTQLIEEKESGKIQTLGWPKKILKTVVKHSDSTNGSQVDI